jgi:hypothetical protein
MAASVKVATRERMSVDVARGIGPLVEKITKSSREHGFSDALRPLPRLLRTFPLSLLFR